MPVPGLVQPLGGSLDDLDRASATLPVPASAGLGAVFSEGAHDFSEKALNWLGRQPWQIQSPEHDFSIDANRPPEAHIPAEEANQRFGVEGLLRFNQPVSEGDAAWQSSIAHRKLLDGTLLARSNPNPLLTFGAGVAGSMFDPAGLTVMLSTGGLGEWATGAMGLRAAEEAGASAAAITRLGRLANVGRAVAAPLVSGAIDNTPYVAASYGLSQGLGEDYSFGDALRDIAAGAVLHTTTHLAMRAAGATLGRFRSADGDPVRSAPATAFEPNPVPAAGVPDGVDALSPTARQGAFALALDQMTDDRPVEVGHLVQQELSPPSLDRLDERSAEPDIASWRPLEADTAVTTRGTEVPVRYGLAELGDLTTSHDDNLGVNPAYPAELQPRARDRAGAQARNYQLEQELNPRLLMNDVGAGSGAPIVAPDGVVESGNGRTIALRRSAASGGPAYARYRAALEAAGHDTSGMKAPVLVRMRDEAMSGPARAVLAREMNADVTERMGAAEQAGVDAARISDASFEQLPDNATPWGSRDFARDFIARVAPDQANVMASADGSLSPEGVRRIKAAVLQRAYGDPRLVGQIFEDEASDIRKLGEAAAEAAPAWARMRAAAASGTIPRELDLTANLTGAMDLVRFAKAEGKPLGELVGELLGQGDMFSGSALSPATEALLRLMYRDAEFKKPTAPDKLAAALKTYARQALEVKPGKDLFGETASEDRAREILANLAKRFASNDAGPIDVVRPPGPSRADIAARAPVVDLRPAGGERDGAGGGLSPDGGRAAEGAGAREPLASLTGDELGAAEGDTAALREAAVAHIEQLAATPIFSDALGAEVKIGKGGIKKMRALSGDPDKLRVVPALPELIAKGELVDSRPPYSAAEKNVKAYHVLEGRVDLGGERRIVRATIREDNNGHFYWDHRLDEKDAAPGGPQATGDKPGPGAEGRDAQGQNSARRPTGEQLIAADPELRELLAETERLEAANGIEAETPDAQHPDTLAEAIHAAAVCLAEEGS